MTGHGPDTRSDGRPRSRRRRPRPGLRPGRGTGIGIPLLDPTPSPWHEASMVPRAPKQRRAARSCGNSPARSELRRIQTRKRAVLLERLAVDLDPAAPAQVADQVGVDGALVLPAALRVAGPDRHVHGAADLLVEQDVAGPAVDPVVGADAELAQAARALVGVEQADQVLLAALGARRRRPCPTRSEAARPRPRARRPSPAGGSVTSPSTESSTGAGEELAVGHVALAVAGMNLRPAIPRRDVGARAR